MFPLITDKTKLSVCTVTAFTWIQK